MSDAEFLLNLSAPDLVALSQTLPADQLRAIALNVAQHTLDAVDFTGLPQERALLQTALQAALPAVPSRTAHAVCRGEANDVGTPQNGRAAGDRRLVVPSLPRRRDRAARGSRAHGRNPFAARFTRRKRLFPGISRKSAAWCARPLPTNPCRKLSPNLALAPAPIPGGRRAKPCGAGTAVYGRSSCVFVVV